MFANTSLIHTKFDYNIFGKTDGNNIVIKSDVRDIGINSDITYFESEQRTIKFGGGLTEHIFHPNVVNTSGDISEFLESSRGDKLANLEFGVYGNIEQSLDRKSVV